MIGPAIYREWVLAAVLLSLPGCGGGDAFAPPACTAPVELLVGTGTAPSFEWPGCAAAGLGVEALDGSGQVMWSVLTVGTQNTLQSPVRYGQRPASPPVFTDPAQPLVAGTRYLVTLFTAESAASGPTLSEIARQEFVP